MRGGGKRVGGRRERGKRWGGEGERREEDSSPVTNGGAAEEIRGVIRGPAVVQVARRTLQPLG